ncbi:MAG: GNAT family N-acetyltransferase [Fimbriimonadaceae bacterium]|nr:GNAT family N-acetyltransferase [Fimbriimonadaceae bacterium]
MNTAAIAELDTAVEVFAHGFSFVRSYTKPYPAQKVGDIWVLIDAATSRSGQPVKYPRKTEVLAHSLPPEEIIRQVQAAGLGWHFLCYIGSVGAREDEIRDAFRGFGYRKLATEWMFVHSLDDIPVVESVPPIRRVTEMSELLSIKRAMRRWPMRLEDLPIDDAPQRLYAAIEGSSAYGWVSSVPVGKQSWVSNLFVTPEQRGKGLGRALMSHLLLEDRRYGIEQSVLMASAAGARLYPHLGYREIGTLQVFCPAKR